MFCNYCGFELNSDQLNYRSKLGVTADGPDMDLVEERLVVADAFCSCCGNSTQSVILDYYYVDKEPNYYDYINISTGHQAGGGKLPSY